MVDLAVITHRHCAESINSPDSGCPSTDFSGACLAGLSPPYSHSPAFSVADKLETLLDQIKSADDLQTQAEHLGFNDERNELYRRICQWLISGVTAVPSVVVAAFTGGMGIFPAAIHGVNMMIKSLDCVAAYLNYHYTKGEQKYLIAEGDAIAGCLYKATQLLRDLTSKTERTAAEKAEPDVKDLYWAKAISGVVSLLTAYLPILVSQYTPNAASDGWKAINKAFMYLKVVSESVFTLFDVYSGVTAEKKSKEIDAAVKTLNSAAQQFSEVVLEIDKENNSLKDNKGRENDFLQQVFGKIRTRLDAAQSDTRDENSPQAKELVLDIRKLLEEIDPTTTSL